MEVAHGLLGPGWVERKALMCGPELSRHVLGQGALLMQALRHEDRHAEQTGKQSKGFGGNEFNGFIFIKVSLNVGQLVTLKR